LEKSRRNDRNVVHTINNRDGFKKSRSQPTPQTPWVTETLIKYYCYRKFTVLLSLLNYCAGVIYVCCRPRSAWRFFNPIYIIILIIIVRSFYYYYYLLVHRTTLFRIILILLCIIIRSRSVFVILEYNVVDVIGRFRKKRRDTWRECVATHRGVKSSEPEYVCIE